MRGFCTHGDGSARVRRRTGFFQKFEGRTEVVCVVTSESDVFVHAMMAENGGEQEVVGAGCYGARRECAGCGAWIGICVLITNSGFIRSR
jgi:hypothetical protein